MSSFQKMTLALFVLGCFLALAGATRELPSGAAAADWLETETASTLEARLKLSGGLSDEGGLLNCWNALMELKSCTNEIVLFFVNGETYLTLECCRAIRIITHKCWPSMFSTLGLTPQEGDVLRGYCDAETAGDGAASPPPPPAALAPTPAGAAAPYSTVADGSNL